VASELISVNGTVRASGKELASENHIQAFLKKIRELDGNGGGVRFCFLSLVFLDHIIRTELC
jgi:hypothetical protein